MSDNKHLQVDLEFLDKDEPVHAKPAEPSKIPSSSPTKYNWKAILIIAGIIIVWAAVSSNDSSNKTSSSSTNSSQSDSVIVGNYSCSSYYSGQADSLKPSDLESSQLDAESADLQRRKDAIKASSDRIDNMYVDNTDQDSLDSYNQAVADHNATLDTLKNDLKAHDAKVAGYNARIDKYNNYLDANCTKRN